MWNTWSRRTRGTDSTTRKNASPFTKRWKNFSINICIRQVPERRAQRARARANRSQRSNASLSILRFDDRRWLIFCPAGIDAASQFAVPQTVEKINTKTDREPNKETYPRFDRQT